MKFNLDSIKTSDFFRLHTDVVVVEADQKDVLYDIGKSNIFPINKEISTLLTEDLMNSPIKTVINQYPNNRDIIVKYLDYFLSQNLGHVTSTVENHPVQDTEYYAYKKFKDAVIYFDFNKDYTQVVNNLIHAGVDCFFIILKEDLILDYSFVDQLTALFENRFVTHVQIVASRFSFDIEEILNYCSLDNFFFTFYNQCDHVLEKMRDLGDQYLYRVGSSTKVFDPYGKQQYNVESFSIYNERFIEALHFNIGLHRMVAIDYDGSIKNYLSHTKSFGNVFRTNVLDVISGKDFQEQWNIKNDNIEKCKTCKYRYCCASTSEVYEDRGKYYKADYCTF